MEQRIFMMFLKNPQSTIQESDIYPISVYKATITITKMERLNGEVRDREKTMRGLKIPDTKILPGYQIYHNYFRPHMALNGMTAC